MTTQTLLTLFLASPGDVAPERDLVCKIVEEYNRTIGAAEGVRVEVVRWETDARPGWGKDGQKLINQLIEKRDHAAFVVLFWNRFGTPTARDKSGTLEEFKLALKKRLTNIRSGKRPPEIMLYFNTAPATLDTHELDQRKAVLNFKASIKDGLYGSYRGKAAFANQFREDYGKWLLDEIAAIKKPRRGSKTKVAAPTSANIPKKPRSTSKPAKRLIMLGDDFFFVGPVTETGAIWTVILKPQNNEEENKIRALCNPRNQFGHFAVAYQLQVGSGTVENSERTSDQKGDFWTLKLRFSPLSTHSMGIGSFNGVSADDIIQMRARWLLLGEKPAPKDPQSGWTTGSDYWIESHVLGNSQDAKPIFPALWKRFAGSAADFSAVAQLGAAYRILSSGICDEIVELKLGPVRAGKMTVSFCGKRARYHGSQDSSEILVKGTCALGN